MKRHSSHAVEAAIVLVALALIFGAAIGGFAVGNEWGDDSGGEALATDTSGHVGEGLPPEAFGDPAKGAALFESKGCADCHSYAGKGGTDAPPLDFMSGHLSGRDVAIMSGRIWNHLPAMLPHFEEEGIPFPSFQDDEMPDLIAYLHSESSGATAGSDTHTEGGTMTGMTTAP